jgi:hypothetical protein
VTLTLRGDSERKQTNFIRFSKIVVKSPRKMADPNQAQIAALLALLGAYPSVRI